MKFVFLFLLLVVLGPTSTPAMAAQNSGALFTAPQYSTCLISGIPGLEKMPNVFTGPPGLKLLKIKACDRVFSSLILVTASAPPSCVLNLSSLSLAPNFLPFFSPFFQGMPGLAKGAAAKPGLKIFDPEAINKEISKANEKITRLRTAVEETKKLHPQDIWASGPSAGQRSIKALETEVAIWQVIKEVIEGMDPDAPKDKTFFAFSAYQKIKQILIDSFLDELLVKIGKDIKDPFNQETGNFSSGFSLNALKTRVKYIILKNDKNLRNYEQSFQQGKIRFPEISQKTQTTNWKARFEAEQEIDKVLEKFHALVVGKSENTQETYYYIDLLKPLLLWPFDQNRGFSEVLKEPAGFFEKKFLQALAEDKDVYNIVKSINDLFKETKEMLFGPVQDLKNLINWKKREYEGFKKEINKAVLALGHELKAGDDEADKRIKEDLLAFLAGEEKKKTAVMCGLKFRIEQGLYPFLLTQAQKRTEGSLSPEEAELYLKKASDNPFLLVEKDKALPKAKRDKALPKAETALKFEQLLIQEGVKAAGKEMSEQLVHEIELRLIIRARAIFNQYLKECDPSALRLFLTPSFDKLLNDLMKGIKNLETMQGSDLVKEALVNLVKEALVNYEMKKNEVFPKIKNFLQAIDNLVAWVQQGLTQKDNKSLKGQWGQLNNNIIARYNKIEGLLKDLKEQINIINQPNRRKKPVQGGIIGF